MRATPRIAAWRRYLRAWPPGVDDSVDEELQFHIDERIAALAAQGHDLETARAQAIAASDAGAAAAAGYRRWRAICALPRVRYCGRPRSPSPRSRPSRLAWA